MKKMVIGLLVVVFMGMAYRAGASQGLSPLEIKRAYRSAYDYERMGDFQDAIRALSKVYQVYPKTYTVNLKLGWLYYLEKRYANSISHYKLAAKVYPNAVEPLLGLSLPLLAQKKWEEVEKLMYEVIKRDYYNYYGNLRLCFVLRKEKKYALAENIARKMLGLYPIDINFLNELGLALMKQGKSKKAINYFNVVITLDPQNLVAGKYVSPVKKKTLFKVIFGE